MSPRGGACCCTLDVNSLGTFQGKLEVLGEREVSQVGTKQIGQPWGLFTVSSNDRSQYLQRPPWVQAAWCGHPLLWEPKSTCVATVGASWAQRKWWLDWFLYWAFYLFFSEWWMNLVKWEGERGQLGLENGLSAAEWLSQHLVISSENTISLWSSLTPLLGEYFFFQPTLIKNNNKKRGEQGGRRKG